MPCYPLAEERKNPILQSYLIFNQENFAYFFLVSAHPDLGGGGLGMGNIAWLGPPLSPGIAKTWTYSPPLCPVMRDDTGEFGWLGLRCPLSLLKCGCGRGTCDSPCRRLCDAYLHILSLIFLKQTIVHCLQSFVLARILRPRSDSHDRPPHLLPLEVTRRWDFLVRKIFFSPSNRPVLHFLAWGLGGCLGGGDWDGGLVNPCFSLQPRRFISRLSW